MHTAELIIAATDPSYDEARQAWNLAIDQRPTAIATPDSVQGVQAAIAYAREQGLRVAPQGSGHGAAALGSLKNSLLLRTNRIKGVEIDAEARTACVGAGTEWIEVTAPASEHGLAPLAGSSPDVSVTGYTLGGGVSWLARKHGLAANSVRSVQMVLADGSVVRADAEHERDLFWAVRGGGGGFGVVTALEFDLHPVPELYAGMLAFPIERAAEVVSAWTQLTPSLPDEMTSIGRVLSFPPLPEVPEPVRGRSLAIVEAAYLGSEADGAELIAPIRALGAEMDTFGMVPPVALSALHMDPPEPVPYAGDGRMLDEVTGETVAAVVEAAGPAGAPALMGFEIRHLGGALGRSPQDAGAVGSLDAPYLAFAYGMVMDPASAEAVARGLRGFTDALSPWEAGREYLNFAEKPTDGAALFGTESYRRLRAIKALHDPANVLQANHEVEPA